MRLAEVGSPNPNSKLPIRLVQVLTLLNFSAVIWDHDFFFFFKEYYFVHDDSVLFLKQALLWPATRVYMEIQFVKAGGRRVFVV